MKSEGWALSQMLGRRNICDMNNTPKPARWRSTCWVCGMMILARRQGAFLCGAVCRKRWNRVVKGAPVPIDSVFFNPFFRSKPQRLG